MKKILISLVAIFLALINLSLPVYAIGFSAGEFLTIKEDLPDDYYFAGGKVVVDGKTKGDLYLAAGEVTINGNVDGDVVIAGGRVTIFGNVGDDVRIVGGQTAIYGNVGDDVIAMSGQVDISKKTTIGGSVISGSGILTIDGNVKQDVQGGFGMLLINGIIDGNVTATVEEKLEVAKDAKINGNLKYSALIEMAIPKEAVKGKIDFNKFKAKEMAEGTAKGITAMYFGWKLFSYFSALVFVIIFSVLFPTLMTKTAEIAKKDPLKTFGIGIFAVVVTFVASMLLMVTVIGIPLGIIGFAALLITMYLAKIFTAVWLSSYVFDYKKAKKSLKGKLILGTALGLLAYYIIGIIPIVGWIVNIVLFLIGVGAIATLKRENLKLMKEKGII
ncbi:MAG: hypothetical protein WC806_02545 [Candidatus Gracilibacteria bacterium]|jgi:cytoskeletal protein CcmA (bactofilin family)